MRKPMTEEQKTRKKTYDIAYKADPVNKARQKAQSAAHNADPVNKARKKAQSAAWRADPVNKAREKAYDAARRADPVNKARKKTYNAAYSADPVNKAHRKTYGAAWRADPVNKARHKECHIARRVDPICRIQLLLRNARNRAAQRGLQFNLEISDIVIPTHCPVTGETLTYGADRRTTPSLDRIIPELGYVRGNVRVISTRANTVKNNGDAALHRKIAEYIEATGQVENNAPLI